MEQILNQPAVEKCRKCLNNWKCEEEVLYDQIYNPGNIFKAGRGECPLFRAIPDEEDEKNGKESKKVRV